MIRTHRAPPDARGFTLVELLVVMVVVGMLAAIVAPVLLNARRSAYEASAKSDIRVLAKEIAAQFVDDSGDLELTSVGVDWTMTRDGVTVATGELSPHNELSARSRITPDGAYCLSVRNTQSGARFWLADDTGLRTGDCPP